MASKILSQEEYFCVLEKIIESGKDPSTIAGRLASVALGTLGGGGIAGVLGGVTTIPLVGISFFSWPILISGGLIGGTVGYIISRVNHHSGKIDYLKELKKQDLKEKILNYSKEIPSYGDKEQKKFVLDAIFTATSQEKITNKESEKLQKLLLNGKVAPSAILDTLKSCIDKNK